MCPNCNATLSTHCKGYKVRQKKEHKKENLLERDQRINSSRRFNPTKEELIEKGIELKWNFRALGRFYNVSDNAVRKRCRLFEINLA